MAKIITEKFAKRFIELNKMNPKNNDVVNAKIDFMRELISSAEATIEAHGGKVCTKESEWSKKQREFVDKHGNDAQFETVLSWACDENGYIVYGVSPFDGVVPIIL